jgi:hypothetical protein
MPRKLLVSLLLVMLSLGSIAVFDNPESTPDEGGAHIATDGTPWPS